MARKNKEKINTSVTPEPLQNNPFGALDALNSSQLKSSPSESKTPPPPATPAPKSRGRLILRRETKDRGGKTVVVVYNFNEVPGSNKHTIADLARELRKKLGCGGASDSHEIVLQGDRPAEVAAALRSMGFRVDGVTQ